MVPEVRNGLVYRYDQGFVVTIPHDGEWLFGLGEDLDDLLLALEESDGLAIEEGGIIVKPYLELQDAMDEMESFTQGRHEVLTSPSITTRI